MLLEAEKRRLIAAKGHTTVADFRRAWDACWAVMVDERSWQHKTPYRRGSRVAMLSTRSQYRAAFVDTPTAFADVVGSLSAAANDMCLQLEPEQTAQALLAAIGYVELDADRAALVLAA